MSRVLALALLIGAVGCSGCGNGSKSPTDQPKTAGEEKIAVPGAKGASPEGQPTVGAAPTAKKMPTADDPRLHLKPEEGTITVDKAEVKAGAESNAKVSLAPVGVYHISTEYPTELWLEAPPGVTVPKTPLKAGGRDKVQGDAATFGEKELAFAVKATADKAGTYEIKGVFKFGICEKDSCHPKKHPITITVAAN
jgi:hypothetical protein